MGFDPVALSRSFALLRFVDSIAFHEVDAARAPDCTAFRRLVWIGGANTGNRPAAGRPRTAARPAASRSSTPKSSHAAATPMGARFARGRPDVLTLRGGSLGPPRRIPCPGAHLGRRADDVSFAGRLANHSEHRHVGTTKANITACFHPLRHADPPGISYIIGRRDRKRSTQQRSFRAYTNRVMAESSNHPNPRAVTHHANPSEAKRCVTCNPRKNETFF